MFTMYDVICFVIYFPLEQLVITCRYRLMLGLPYDTSDQEVSKIFTLYLRGILKNQKLMQIRLSHLHEKNESDTWLAKI